MPVRGKVAGEVEVAGPWACLATIRRIPRLQSRLRERRRSEPAWDLLPGARGLHSSERQVSRACIKLLSSLVEDCVCNDPRFAKKQPYAALSELNSNSTAGEIFMDARWNGLCVDTQVVRRGQNVTEDPMAELGNCLLFALEYGL
jgi:hypothetical protein